MKRVISILFVNSALIGLGIVILELFFGSWVRSDSLNRLSIIRSQTLNYDIEDLYDSPSGRAIYTRDQYGLRGSFKNPSEIDILTVGGSTTDQRYVADGQTWQDVIQEHFRSIGKEVVLANAGVDGQSTVGHIRSFEWWFPMIPDLRPTYIIFYVGVNDFYIEENYGYDALVIDSNMSVRQHIRQKSALYHVLRTLRGVYQAQIRHKIGHGGIDVAQLQLTNRPLQSSYDILMRDRLTEYAERLDVLIARSREFGAEPIFATQPSRLYRLNNGTVEGTRTESLYGDVRINGVDYYYMMRKLDEVTISVCREHNAVCFDIAKEQVWTDSDFYDLTHMTPSGTRKLGGLLFEILEAKF